MGIRKEIRRPFRVKRPGIDVVGDLNASIAMNVGETGTVNRVSTTSHVSAVQSTARPAPKQGGNHKEDSHG